MFNLRNIDLSKEYRTTDDEIKSAKSYIYQLVEELDYRLGQIYGEGGVGGLMPGGGTDEQPIVGDNGKSKWSNIGYLTDQEYLLLALELAFEYSADERWRAGEFCVYNDGVYECLKDIDTPEPFTESHWKYLGSASGASGGSDHSQPSPGIDITIDSILSTLSTNPVQNRVITNALNNKEGLMHSLSNTEIEELLNSANMEEILSEP